MQLTDMPIRQRLWIGFGSVLTIMAVMVALISYHIHITHSLADSIANNITPQARASSDLLVSVEKERTGLRGWVLAHDRRFFSEYQDAVHGRQVALQKLQELADDAQARKIIDEITDESRHISEHENYELDILNKGKSALAYQYHLQNIRPVALNLINMSDRLSRISYRHMDAALQEYGDSNYRLELVAVISFVIATLVAICFAAITAGAITRPTMTIAQVAQAVAKGDYAQAISLGGSYSSSGKSKQQPRSEGYRILRDLEIMAQTLELRERGLKAHADVSAICASTIDIDNLLNDSLKELVKHSGSQLAAVYMYKDSSFFVQETYGLSSDNANAALLSSEGLIEQAWQSMRAIQIKDIPVDTRFALNTGLGGLVPRSIICMPMLTEGEALGVIVLASLCDYDGETVSLIETTVTQISVALSNAIHHSEIKQLAEELQDKNQQLDAQNEELQCQNEELQAQSEEIQAQSEEIQAQNEELNAQSAELQEQNARLELAEWQARVERERMQSIINNLPEGIIIVNAPEGRVEIANEAALALCGVDSIPDVVMTEHPKALNLYHADGSPASWKDLPLSRAIINGEVCTGYELLIRQPLGREVPILCNCVPLRGSDGEVVGAAKIFQDISDIKERQSLLQTVYERQRTIADMLQTSFLSTVPARAGNYEIAHRYIPAQEDAQVGGDFYDVIEFPNGKLGIVMADVSGKGVSAAVYTAMAKHMLRGFAHEDSNPAAALTRLNSAVSRFIQDEIFVTLFYGVLDPRQHKLTYANAGHELPMLVSHDQNIHTLLESTGPAIGMIPKASYIQQEVDLSGWDALLLYTDGVTEARNKGSLLGIDGLACLVLEINDCSAHDMTQRIIDYVLEYSKGRTHDDIALITIKSTALNVNL